MRDYYANFINHENSTDQRHLFNAVNCVFRGSRDELYPPQPANELGNFFFERAGTFMVS